MVDPNSLSILLNPNAVGAAPGIGGLSSVPGMGQVPGMEMPAIPTQGAADAMANYANSAATPNPGNQMAAILGMEALKGISAGASQPRSSSGQGSAGVAPRGNKVETKDQQAQTLDPQMYLAMMGRGLG